MQLLKCFTWRMSVLTCPLAFCFESERVQGVTVDQWEPLLFPQSKKIAGSSPGLSVCSLHVFTTFVCVSSGRSECVCDGDELAIRSSPETASADIRNYISSSSFICCLRRNVLHGFVSMLRTCVDCFICENSAINYADVIFVQTVI